MVLLWPSLHPSDASALSRARRADIEIELSAVSIMPWCTAPQLMNIATISVLAVSVLMLMWLPQEL